MRILHLTPGFVGNRLYQDLYSALAQEQIKQIVYVPMHDPRLSGRNEIEIPEGKIFYSICYHQLDRLLFYSKRDKIARDVQSKGLLEGVDLIHAHFMSSMGAVAFEISKQTGIPYVVSIRNTDVNVFLTYGYHLRGYLRAILDNAKYIIFLSPSIQRKVLSFFPAMVSRTGSDGTAGVLPNGINDYWFKEGSFRDGEEERSSDFLFVGALDRNKNVKGLIRAFKLLKRNRPETTLGIVGDGNFRAFVDNQVHRDPSITTYGHVHDRNRLRQIFAAHRVFVLPSFHETFGISYVEAMSQGLPIVYSREQGVDGFFPPETIGESTDPHDPKELSEAMSRCLARHREYSPNCVREAALFTWPAVAAKLRTIYSAAATRKD